MHSNGAGLLSLLSHSCQAKRTQLSDFRGCSDMFRGRGPCREGSWGQKADLLSLQKKKLSRDVSGISYEWRGQLVYKSEL